MSLPAEISLLYDRQNERSAIITQAVDRLKSYGKDKQTKGVIRALLTSTETTWNEYQSAHNEIVRRVAENVKWKEAPYFVENEYSIIYDSFIQTKGFFLDLLERFPEKKMEITSTMSTRKTPDIPLPHFDGDTSNWLNFRDKFISMVKNNNQIPVVEKLHYLQGCISGRAAATIAGLDLSSGNFSLAWQTLLSEYDNLALQVRSHVRDLLNIPAVRDGSLAEIQRIYTDSKLALGALNVLEREVEHWDDIICELTLMKLDPRSIELWENKRQGSTIPPTWDELLTFLSSRVRALEMMACTSGGKTSRTADSGQTTKKPQSNSGKSADAKPSAKSHSARKVPTPTCPSCQAAHKLKYCPEYLAKTPQQRFDFVKRKNRCSNCLGTHQLEGCFSTGVCQICRLRHHTTLHLSSANTGHQEQKPVQQQQNNPSNVNSVHVNAGKSSFIPAVNIAVLLATARVIVCSKSGKEVLVRALIDQGSEVSFVSEKIVQQLRLERRRSSPNIIGIGSSSAGQARGSVLLHCRSHAHRANQFDVHAYILPRLSGYTPRCKVFNQPWPHLDGLELADPQYFSSDAIDLLLGADILASLLEEGLVKGAHGTPVAQNTQLGWILSGAVAGSSGAENRASHTACAHQSSLAELGIILRRYWELEEVTPADEHSLDDQKCEEVFDNTHERDSFGRFIVHFPFKSSPTTLGSSRSAAVAALDRMNRKFLRDASFRDAYNKFIREYEELGHMTRIEDDGSDGTTSPCYYLPHHGVMQTSANVTKLRVVFNGSQATSSGLSLNDLLLVGRNLNANLVKNLVQWRCYEVAYGADVEKMYRQVLIHPEERKWQRILYRTDFNSPIEVFELNTVTYGIGSSANQSVASLQQSGKDCAAEYPEASKIIQERFYVDDLLSGADTVEATLRQIREVSEILRGAGFPLKKWVSNSPELLAELPPGDLASTASLSWKTGPSHKALGLTWLPDQDTFVFVAAADAEVENTKRSVMSRIAQLFDPLGWLSPLSVRAKILLRELWHLKLAWDAPLALEQKKSWENYRQDLDNVSSLISIPRWLGTNGRVKWIELHGFSDASKDAYSAAVYLRVLQEDDSVVCTLVLAKTKVTPLQKPAKKSHSIARLELCGAALLAKLTAMVNSILEVNISAIHLWTDSMVSLCWIRSDPGRWQPFVANRVESIHSSTPSAQWHHINGEDNPADCASRGITVGQLAFHSLWWHGPARLSASTEPWPDSDDIQAQPECEDEANPRTSHRVTTREVWSIIYQFSSLHRLLRCTAWWLRYFQKVSDAVKRRKGLQSEPTLDSSWLTMTEIEEARLYWCREVQRAEFGAEIAFLNSNQPLPSRRLAKLAPFVDGQGVLRVGGRLKHSLLDWDEIHPIILPASSHLSRLIIEAVHQDTLHGGTQMVLCVLRRQYWILGARTTVKGIIHSCLRCLRFRAITMTQQMGDLPARRVQRARPFLHTGVDFAGPVHLRTSQGRGHKSYKGYICVFVCFVTRAIHLEAVAGYSTDEFIEAYERFVSRRGIPETITSDQGTNFVGADAELARLFTQASKEFPKIIRNLQRRGTQWIFNPPGAPHFGGLWESAVKSVKHHLVRVIGETRLTYKEMSTLLCKIEACLNSRPLRALTDDPDDFVALTPGHFLIQDQLLAVPRPTLDHVNPNRLTCYERTEQLSEHFWSRWHQEHLTDLQTRQKWHQEQPNVSVDDLVIIKAENAPPTRWPLARVIETHPGPDGTVRVATLRTSDSTFQRPIHKLVRLIEAKDLRAAHGENA